MNYFTNVELFSELSESDQLQLSNFCQLQGLSEGKVLFHEGDEAQAMYIVYSGELAVEKQIHGETQEIAHLVSGDIVGEIAFFSGKEVSRNATVRAKKESQVITIIRFSIEQILQKYPDLHKKIQNIIEERSKK